MDVITVKELQALGMSCTALDKLNECLPGRRRTPLLIINNNCWVIGGIERMVGRLMNYFQDQYKIILLTPPPAKTHFPLPSEIVHVCIDSTISSERTQRIVDFVKLMSAELYWGNDNLAADALGVYPLLNGTGTKTIMLNHYNWLYPYKWEAFCSKALKKRNDILDAPDIIINLNECSAHMGRLSCRRKIGVIPNPNPYSAVEYIPESDRERLVLAVGRFDDWNKRIDRTLTVFNHLAQLDPSVKFLVVGNLNLNMTMFPTGPTLNETIQKLGLSLNRIEFVPETNHVEQYYKRAKVIVFNSDSEAFSLCMTEAEQFGIPSVASFFPGIEDIITDGENGYLFAPQETAQMALKIKELLDDPQLWRKISHRALQLSKRFSEERIMQKWDTLFHALLTCSTRPELEARLEAVGIIHTNQMSERALYASIADYEDSLQMIITRLCRCDDCIDNLAFEQLLLKERIEYLGNQLQLEKEKTAQYTEKPPKKFRFFKAKS